MMPRFIFNILLLVVLSSANQLSHKYETGNGIPIWTHSVCPFYNPQETYSYYSVGLCTPTEIKNKEIGISESITGYSFIQSNIPIRFKVDIKNALECKERLDIEGIKKVEQAIMQQYWYQWFIDDLPVWGLVGEIAENPTTGVLTPYLYTHRDITLSTKGERIVEVSLNSSELKPLPAPNKQFEMTYGIKWVEISSTDDTVGFERRFEKYFDTSFFEHQIHWFSLFNSLMLALFLVGVVAMVLMRTVHREYSSSTTASAKKNEEDPESQQSSTSSADLDIGEESGWKQVAGDVFRPPQRPMFFSALVGTGAQLLAVVTLILTAGALGNHFVERGEIVGWFVFLYAIAAIVGGFSSGGFYASIKGKSWIRAMGSTALFFPVFCFCVWQYVNFVAAAHDSLMAAPFSAQVAIASLWLFGVLPLTFIGTLVGRHWNSSSSSSPSAVGSKPTNPFPGPIPFRKWYQGSTACIILGGVLPFGTIFIELYFAFAGVWHYKFYYVFGFAFIIFVALIVVTACVSIIAVYYLLNSEDYRWQWTSFLSGASTGMYTFAYCVYFYNYRTMMSGMLQATCFFAISLLFSSILSLVCGWVAFTSSSWFVRRIYTTGKTD